MIRKHSAVFQQGAFSFLLLQFIIAALVDLVEIFKNREIKIICKVSAEQFLGRIARIA
jgi:hypothetical protein